MISSLAEDIEDKDKEELKIENAKFKISIANTKATKNNSEVSGDTSIQTNLHDGKFMMAISDRNGVRA